MAIPTDLGKVMATSAGKYSISREYQPQEIVHYLGDAYVTIKPCVGILPIVNDIVNEEYWARWTNIKEAIEEIGGVGGVIEEIDPTVPAWAKEPNKPAYAVNEISGAVPNIRTVNGKSLSANIELDNTDVGAAPTIHTHAQYLTEETDPTVPAWAKAASPPGSTWNDITGKPNFHTVATSGSYTDLSSRPNLATVATSGQYADLSGRPVVPSTASDIDAAPTNHASSGTSHGVSSSSLYGHAKMSQSIPANLGTANAGTDNGEYASGSHVHALPTAAQVGAIPITGGTLTGNLISNNPPIATSAVRNIIISTTDLTPGSSALATGTVYLVYE